MRKTALTLGYTAGILVLLSAAAHMLLGWSGMRTELGKAGAPAELIDGVQMGWQFGGVAMIVFAAIIFAAFQAYRRGQPLQALPLQAIGLGYVLYGLAQWLFAGSGPFALVFILPGGLLLTAARLAAARRTGHPPADTA
ncbi:MAG: hypothetical protein ACJ8HI_06785 [Massilia sp.]